LLSIAAYAYRKLKRELEFRRKLQLELTRERNQFETLFNTSADGNTIVVNGKFILCNQAFADMLKMSIDDVFGAEPEDLSPLYQPDGELSSVKAEKAIKEGLLKGEVRFEWVHKTSKNEPIWCDIILRKIVYNDQVCAYAQIRNIDDIKILEISLLKLKVKAEQANVAKSQFLANMSHEIRTPMNAVLGFAELLEKSEGLNSEQQGYLRSIKSGAKGLLQIINDILDLSKIEAGKLQIKLEPFDMRLFMEDLKSIFAPLSQTKGIEFYIQYPKDMPPTWIMDELRLRQILFNLIGNAFKFTDIGSVTVSLIVNHYKKEEELLNVTLNVIDTGIGIASKDIGKVFQDLNKVMIKIPVNTGERVLV
jgi:two-component system sensor histidine kinase EvgS